MRQWTGAALAAILLWAQCQFGVATAAGGVYKWVDAQGQVHYDDHSLVRGTRLTQALLADRRVAADPDYSGPVPAEWVAAFARDCALAKARGETLLNAEAVYGITPDGDEFRYTDQQRRLMMLETAEAARSVCAPGAARAAFEAAQRAAQDS
jgi:hypothetical protein